ncbi:MAG: NnrS family protein [Xanthobacteraceae bacterium]
MPFGKFDVAAIAASGAALVLWIAMPVWPLTAAALIAAGGIQLARMSRWAGLSTWREPLVLVLHGGYAFVPIGFILVGASILWPISIPPIAALHAWSAGAVALMTLAVMTRASLGHTGHELTADLATGVVYLAALVAVVCRLAAPIFPDLSADLLSMAAMSWIVAFGGFAFVYGPKLARARQP